MSELINTSEFNPDILVETVKGNKVPVSFQVMQSLYNEITGKTEEIGKQYKNRYQVEMNDLVQLNCKMNQAFEQYNLVTNNCTITIYYEEDNNERFSSFARFSAFDPSKNCPVKYVHLEYNFLIRLPVTQTTQSYNISIRIGSLISHYEEWQNDGMLDVFSSNSFNMVAVAEAKINYIDYMVAQTFKRLIDDWFESLDVATEGPIVSHFQKYINKYAMLSKNIFAASMIFVLYWLLEHDVVFSNSERAFNELLQLLLVGFVLLVFILYVSSFIGSLCRKSLQNIMPLSYVCLNRGDEKLIKKLKKSNKRTFLKGVISIISSFFIGILSSTAVWYFTLP
ncbi:hypothetical protein GNP81_07210 [Aliivibrio fischeri]|uniref:hypothetical protein n=1 Tax=Aliivibrio fischeri TaxID=668 RepID=UPI0012D9A9AF|nr:hypothetical protein [Aliivibrio fischeri]MUK60873.1 hypothetical protein [Aliivibrio fischeri]MUL20621.1 hypothetical protein [Aliivibrio fischeri]MUL24396.1 hypothetical protein [Aliivibrio fischeri]